MRRSRWPVALGVSVVVHGLLVAAALGSAVWRGLATLPKPALELVEVSVKSVEDLPLGPPPPAGRPEGGEAPAPRRHRPRLAAHREGATVTADAGAPSDAAPAGATGDAGPRGDGGTRRSRDLRAYGPEGSRVTALLRLDRLRKTPDAEATIAAVDGLLRHLPDRRRLLEGTPLDLYRDFDALLIATPNPLDDAVTFLAARHHVPEPAFRAALEAGAAHAGRPLVWRTDTERPVGVRSASRTDGRLDRDDRLFVLLEPGLALMAPPAYAKLLLPEATPAAGPRDGAAPPPKRARWQELVKRIDAEDGALPDDAVLMLTASHILRAVPRPVPGTRGQVDDDAPYVPGPFGLPLPDTATLLVTFAPQPALTLTADLGTEASARTWEDRFPSLKDELLGNPILLLSGLSRVLSRLTLARDGAQIDLRLETTAAELRELLQMLSGTLGPPR